MTLLSHVDVRVRDRVLAAEFYDAILNLLGAVMRVGDDVTVWTLPERAAAADAPVEGWFAISEDAAMVPGSTRIAFLAPSRGTVNAIATYLPAIGARAIQMPHEAYGAHSYACFFEDLDGNKLEVVALG
jgi:catechol 2,3-dioxygenase-like lactoylglutathione lyase family enzyme